MSTANAARQLARSRPGHPVITVYLDLDPERFATAPARTAQIHSLIDEASRALHGRDHEDRMALRRDLERVREYLLSREPPYKGAHALAVFCCGPANLFECVQLTRPVPGRVVIEPTPYVEPLAAASSELRWHVVLVNRRIGRIMTGEPDRLQERGELDDQVHGQHDQGGWSQANYQRSVEKDVDEHLRRVAAIVERHWHRERFDRLALGGPPEIVPRFESLLGEELRSRLVPGRLEIDLSNATVEKVREAVVQLAAEDERRREREALDQLGAGLGTGARAAAGAQETVDALNERRVATLLLERGFDRSASRCPSCGMVVLDGDGKCPADGTSLEEVESLREACVASALAQDSELLSVRHFPDLGRFGGIGALLRF